jgi:hypothetical protein
MPTKRFPIAVVLSATTGHLLCNMDDVYAILNHVTGDNLFTHQLPRAFDYGKPLLVARDARLGERVALPSDLANGTREEAFRRVAACVEVHVATLGLPAEMDVPSFAAGWSRMDPVAELMAMMSKDVA